MLADQLPVAFLSDLWPEAAVREVSVTPSTAHQFELPYGEQVVLASIVRLVEPRLVLEIGTFTGRTTRLIADHAPPCCVVHTLDLPRGTNSNEPAIWRRIGEAFRDDSRYTERIEQHWGDSSRFDYSPFRGADLVFIDGAHDYESVRVDSRSAMSIVSERGVVVWDDYGVQFPGVWRALHELPERDRLVRIARTRLVVYRPGGFEGTGLRNERPWADAPLKPV